MTRLVQIELTASQCAAGGLQPGEMVLTESRPAGQRIRVVERVEVDGKAVSVFFYGGEGLEADRSAMLTVVRR